jgi:hypothetical protein
MVTEIEYIAYFTNLASKHKQIQHQEGTKNAFFFIPLAYDLGEIDNAIRNTKSTPFIAVDALRGSFDDNDSENHVQIIEGQFTIADKAESGKAESIRTVQDACLKIGLEFITRLKHDARKKLLFNPHAKFTISNVLYDPVGPMSMNHYGYTFRFQITCPFGYTVDSGTWLDK